MIGVSSTCRGRGVFSLCNIPERKEIYLEKNPFSYVIFREYRKEVCAYCFKYEINKTCSVKLSVDIDNSSSINSKSKSKSKSSKNGNSKQSILWFCSLVCKNNWIQTYDYDGLLSQVLSNLEMNYISIKKGKRPNTEIYNQNQHQKYDADSINTLWNSFKSDTPVDKVEYDYARYLAICVIKFYRVSLKNDITKILNDINLEPQFSTNVKEEEERKIEYEYEYEYEYEKCKIFMSLQSNEIEQKINNPELLKSHIKSYYFLLSCLPTEILSTKFVISIDFIRHALGVEAVNAFGIWQQPLNSESECFGSAVYLNASFFNHSCNPNVKKIRNGSQMCFITTRKIYQGEELFIQYGHNLTTDNKKRKMELYQQWHFMCQCELCLS